MDAEAARQLIVAVDDLAVLATFAFFMPASVVVLIVVFVMLRDRRRGADDELQSGSARDVDR